MAVPGMLTLHSTPYIAQSASVFLLPINHTCAHNILYTSEETSYCVHVYFSCMQIQWWFPQPLYIYMYVHAVPVLLLLSSLPC